MLFGRLVRPEGSSSPQQQSRPLTQEFVHLAHEAEGEPKQQKKREGRPCYLDGVGRSRLDVMLRDFRVR
jgi:hypothetical protein